MSEILAPAGSPEMLKAAIRAGADAVYFGLGRFNARVNAENFTFDNIGEHISYCKRRGVKAYLTLNTLVSDREINSALDTVKVACEIGVDAVLTQDMGLISLIKQCAPDLPLHASTQMAVHNVAGLEMLHKLGYSRAVLARENSFKEIEKICNRAKQLNIEIEVFVQGALCMCVSGQCLMSATLGGRSGNRGLCAGTCRLPFSLQGSNDEYALSLKDLSLLSDFHKLSQAGVESFKIEGRMKRPEYAAAAVAAAVAARDNAPDFNEKLELLKNVFSRSGFTKGYFDMQIDKNMFGIRSGDDIENAKKTVSKIHSFYRGEPPKIALDFEFVATEGLPIKLSALDGEHTVTVTGDTPEIAKKTATSEQFIKDKLSKLGGTGYHLNQINITLSDNLAISAGALSDLKSRVVEQIEQKRGKLKPYNFNGIKLKSLQNRTARTPKLYLSLHRISQLPECVADGLILPLNTPDTDIKNLILSNIDVWIKTPPVIWDETPIFNRLLELKASGVKTILAENIGTLHLIEKAGLNAVGGATLNCFNSYAPDGYNLNRFIISREMHKSTLQTLTTNALVGAEVYGKIPMMTVRNCPVRARVGCKNCTGCITDRKGARFAVMCEDNVTRIYNDRPTYLCDRTDLLELLDFCVLNFTTESKEEAAKVIDLYRRNSQYNGDFTRGMIQNQVK